MNYISVNVDPKKLQTLQLFCFLTPLLQ